MAASAPGSLALAVLVTLLVDVFAALAAFVASVELVALAAFAASAVFVETLSFSHGAQKYFRDASKGANADPV
jgi:uncharacterized protein (DUF697 family)